jgi:outer membrane protein TolC
MFAVIRWKPMMLRLTGVLLAACAPAALALQPLEQFIEAAKKQNPDNAEAVAGMEQQAALADATLGRALPSVSARGTYTRNQYQVALGPLPAFGLNERTFLQRFNQLDAFFTANVPLVDVSTFVRIAAAHTSANSAVAQMKATRLQVESAVVQGYFQLVANQALVSASQRALDVAKENLALTQARLETGKAAALDVERARAEVERQAQLLTAAQLQVELAARALQSASGVTPDLTSQLTLEDDLRTEAPLDTFQRPDTDLPQMVVAIQSRKASEQQATAQRLSLVPTLSGNASEHVTNAAGFVGQPWSYMATLNLTWQLDYTTISNIRVQDAAVGVARAREQRAHLSVHDAIHRAWETVASSIARSRSARAQQEASVHASKLAQDRYEAGAATQLDLLQAQRDAFSAEVSRIQADADLANSRLQLRLAAAIDPFPSPQGKTP